MQRSRRATRCCGRSKRQRSKAAEGGRHCERSEAIHSAAYPDRWIASSLALLRMTKALNGKVRLFQQQAAAVSAAGAAAHHHIRIFLLAGQPGGHAILQARG